MRVPRFVNYWMPAVVWMLLMFVGSTDVLSAQQTSRFLWPLLHWFDPHLSVATFISIHFALRKTGHVVEYAILATLLWRGLRGTFAAATTAAIAISTFVVTAIFAASDEFHQSFVPSRTASPRDVMIDTCGAVIGLLICLAFARLRTKKLAQVPAKL